MLEIKNLKAKNFLGNILESFKRFPSAYLFVLMTVVLAVLVIENKVNDDSEIAVKIFFWAAGGFPLSIMLKLLSEKFSEKIKSIVTQTVPQIIWFVFVWFYLGEYILEKPFPGTYLIYQTISAEILICVLYFTLIFLGKKNDLNFWRFTGDNISLFIVVSAVCGILHGGLCLLLLALDQLFAIKIPYHAWAHLSVFCWMIILPQPQSFFGGQPGLVRRI